MEKDSTYKLKKRYIIINELLNIIDKSKLLNDFKLEKNIFYRDENNYCRSLFRINFIKKSSAVYSTFGLRFNEIEKIIDNFKKQRSNKFDMTIFIDTGDLLVQTNNYKFYIDENVDVAIKRLIDILYRIAIPYFKKYCEYESLYNLLCVEKYVDNKIGNDQYHNETISKFFRCLTLIKILKLNEHQKLKDYHLSYLEEKDYGYKNITQYLKFYQFLFK